MKALYYFEFEFMLYIHTFQRVYTKTKQFRNTPSQHFVLETDVSQSRMKKNKASYTLCPVCLTTPKLVFTN